MYFLSAFDSFFPAWPHEIKNLHHQNILPLPNSSEHKPGILYILSFEKEKSHLHPEGLFCGVIQQMILSEHQSKHLDQYHVFPFEQLFHNHDYKYQNIHDINIRYLLP